ncbi:FAD-dependent monooxygenase [Nocardia sp. CY41]|uniref:FAD-dependent monooxygenase n=1 Tax=Nocardia sp. CY41 TaxID=2608686 RepID=UPI0013598E8D|nr:FAD-dependent monooxygenase [Nocardia sp. CY41]
MSSTVTDHEVVVVGGGPVGLMMAIELGRRGVDVCVIERRISRLRHPRAIGLHARTMEIMRQLGWAEDVRRVGNLPLEKWSSFGYMTRLNAPDIGAVDLLADPLRVDRAYSESPEMIAWCAQDVFEPLLVEKSGEFPSITITTGEKITGLEQFDDHVVLSAESESGEARKISAKYAIGADGAHSTIRRAIEVQASVSPTKGHQLNACFVADLSPYLGDRNHILWWIINRDTTGAFLTYDGDRRWVYSWGYDPDQESIEDYPLERCSEVIRKAIGDATAKVEVESVFPWTIDGAIADTFCIGRTFLVGDAAHRLPPSGGFGMNSGIQDAQNLAWKLALVLRGHAAESLLDTYDEERRAVAWFNLEQVNINVEASSKVGWVMTDPDQLAQIEEPSGEAVRQQIADAIPLQEDQYWSYGQQFGFSYESEAVIADGTTPPASTVSDYKPTATPGAHAPHLWLRDTLGNRISTVDLLHSDFVLLTAPEGGRWREELRELAAVPELPTISSYTIGDDADFSLEDGQQWLQRYGISSTGAVLVRPDGHVCFRAPDDADRLDYSLGKALSQLLQIPLPQ